MKAEERFLRQPKTFWANVRAISQAVGYTHRRQNAIRVPSMDSILKAYEGLGLSVQHLLSPKGGPSEIGTLLLNYFEHRAQVLNNYVEPRLMDAERACGVFEALRADLDPSCPLPYNKQKGEKKKPAYLSAIVNMLIEAHSNGRACDYDPRQLTIITKEGIPLRTLARRLDGAFPSTINPTAVWEVKEYYYTTTFGSRVADGIYEALLDGMELAELRERERVRVKHYLMVDSHYTWWICGKSYLCRLVDMLHMGYLDEVLFGHEVVERLPGIVRDWQS